MKKRRYILSALLTFFIGLGALVYDLQPEIKADATAAAQVGGALLGIVGIIGGSFMGLSVLLMYLAMAISGE